MLGTAKQIYFATRKRHDQLFNTYFMRPIAAFVVSLLAKTPITPNQVTILNLVVFIGSAGLLIWLPGYSGALIAVVVLEASYLLDCADGMLARHRSIASTEGHLFDFFTDEIKAVLLVATLGIRAYVHGGRGPDLVPMAGEHFLIATIIGVVVIASATSLTNFVRRPELTGKATPVSAHYETEIQAQPQSLPGKIKSMVMTFLRFLNHYPSHIWLFALAASLDLFFWIYILINTLYLAQGWLGLLIRFGRPRPVP